MHDTRNKLANFAKKTIVVGTILVSFIALGAQRVKANDETRDAKLKAQDGAIDMKTKAKKGVRKAKQNGRKLIGTDSPMKDAKDTAGDVGDDISGAAKKTKNHINN